MENIRRLVLCYAIQDSVTRTGVDSRLASVWLFGSRVTFVVVVRCKPLVRCFKHMLRRINKMKAIPVITHPAGTCLCSGVLRLAAYVCIHE